MAPKLIAMMVAILVATPARASPPEGLIKNPEFVSMITEVGTYYVLAGRCSAHISVEDFKLLMHDAQQWGPFASTLKNLYTKGQTDTSIPAPTAKACQGALDETHAMQKAAMDKFGASLRTAPAAP